MEACRKRGLEFLNPPKSYYDNLRERLKHAKITVAEDMDKVHKPPLFLNLCYVDLCFVYVLYISFRHFI